MEKKADIAVIGLAVMGENLILNMESRGFSVACYNRTAAKVDEFLSGRAKGLKITGCRTLQDLRDSLERPRRIMMMVRAGQAVDSLISSLIPLLDPGDVLIDGGNSLYTDTDRRCDEAEKKGILYCGTGISGGEEGALKGPSIMPGGSSGAWPLLREIFQLIAAKAGDGTPCCSWVGPGGSGHFVKMVHNGIEYGDMQLIAEAYHIMARGLGMTPEEMSDVFSLWNRGDLDSYLIEITADILSKKDEDTGKHVIDLILDTAGQKGTGKWTSRAGLDLGVGIPQIAEAVFARFLSAAKKERTAASLILPGPGGVYTGNRENFLKELEKAVYAAKVCSYAQGFDLLRAASEKFGWNIDYGDVAAMWREGCIIRAGFLENIKESYAEAPQPLNLLLAPYFKQVMEKSQMALRETVKTAADLGIPVPAVSSALSYYDSFRCGRLPANMIQAQRDYFGAHTYERIDKPVGEYFHTNWTGRGGSTSSSEYNV